ncbi:MATE family efflux transporter [Paraclostridium bifermentans]|uniref:Multidrug export protein MepA n=2 Tax=Peptostreptococcaceae TaxID=186804 RepID=A0AA44DNK9_PARBF|nr:MATE family efflux transporter [Paraclostridium bifermentans]EQK47900.1 MATE efflux family protein [[Clostridium] bifermentans ATCC 19299] [Paraclostridium bifermentans ATCC 19299]MBN8049340.1 MATE family efflux transporter [Paraclostridium bifermentans]MCE9677238.1 MATE family efflux transporter [Paraclostridium bifermentans]MCR1877172.1 MATE family efflux transporter [Paraclostridium bifermentans]NME11000.1 MATE family efflux transporter [Paraclostridium bifermentans]
MGKQTTDLGKGSVGKLLFQLALPAIIAQLVNVLYNIVDRIFIGRMPNGELAMAGVGVAFPIIMIVSAFSALVGMGGAPLAAIKMGEKDNDGAEKIMTNSFSTLVIIAIILTVSLLIFKENILWAFGASKDTIGYANDYIGIYLIGTLFVQIGLGLNPFINTQGFAKTGMITVLIGAIINIVLDPILIFGFNMGVKGAALATISAQFVSAVWVLLFLVGKKSVLKIRKKYIVPNLKVIGPILLLGISPFIMQATESLVIISMNNNLAKYGGDLAIGAMTIMSSVMQIILLPMMGLTQGAQPIISFNYGADKLDRVRKTFKLLLVSCLVYTTIMWGAIMIFPQVFVSIFNSNPQLVEITVWSMRIYFAGILLFGAQIACQQTFLALGQAKISMILALLRKIILLIPLIFILPIFFENKLQGVLTAEPVADITAAIVTIICFSVFYKKTLSIDHSMQPTVEIAKTKDE